MFQIKDRNFYIDGKKISIYSGAVHYFRILPEYWYDRLLKLKFAGFNTVETYVCWNLHQPTQDKFDFDNRLDLEKFVKIATDLGLYIIIRPGPYICAEWDFGGLPSWLLAKEDIAVRCYNDEYLSCVEHFYKVLLGKLKPFIMSNGGNIIAMQVENEYGSFGNDKKYLKFVEKLIISCGIDVLLFTSDGADDSMLTGGTLPSVLKTINFGSRTEESFQKLEEHQSNMPYMCMEFWNGWFDHWGEEHHTRDVSEVIVELNKMLKKDVSINFYMFHGGTNFGFSNGANLQGEKYCPTITSYDDDALLNEWGGYTEKYYAVREILLNHQNIKPEKLPDTPKLQNIGTVALKKAANLFQNLKKLGQNFQSVTPKSMEYFGQNFGFILYRHILEGKQNAKQLKINGIRDRAYIFINNELKGIIDRNDQKHYIDLDDSLNSGGKIDILVENMGRINYGHAIMDRKGILDSVCINNQSLFHWDIYTLPFSDISVIDYENSNKLPAFFKGEFRANSKNDCFVHLDNFTKGLVFINGFNLGRYWNIGPQLSLYLPGVLLKEKNEIVIFELENCTKPEVDIKDNHILNFISKSEGLHNE